MNLLDRAIIFAVHAHEGQYRKIGKNPYITHPMEAVTIAETLCKDEEILAAAMLHDTVEDTSVTLDDIQREFGERVYRLVKTETENKRKNQNPNDTWRIRKEESLQELENAGDIGIEVIWLADKLANIRSFYRLFTVLGNDVWKNTHAPNPKDHEWYYRRVAELLPHLTDTVAYREYMNYLDLMFPKSNG